MNTNHPIPVPSLVLYKSNRCYLRNLEKINLRLLKKNRKELEMLERSTCDCFLCSSYSSTYFLLFMSIICEIRETNPPIKLIIAVKREIVSTIVSLPFDSTP